MADQDHNKMSAKSKARLIFRFVISITIMGLILFYLPGNVQYWQGWVYFGSFIFLAIFTMLILPSGLTAERMSPGGNVKKWDYVFIAIYTPLNFLIPLFCAYDANQLHWSSMTPPYLNGIAAIFVLTGTGLTVCSTWTNRYFSSMVRIQKDRGQTVIQDGPYKIVRHPGYLGGVILYAFLPLLLNSLLGLIGSLLLVIAFFVRTYLEDQTLQNELEGYIEYTRKVSKRLIPFIW
jgi:protein-S-isoprenylcysteine O-methyltransferase Ste14